jgi:integral membrane protein (TIGR01906 family)
MLHRFYAGGLSLLIALLVIVLIVLGAVRLVVSEPYLQFVYTRAEFPADPYGFTLADRLRLAPYALRYMTENQPIAYLGALTFPDGGALYNERELEHMVDVQTVFRTAMLVLLGTLGGLAVVLIALRWRAGRLAWARGLCFGGILLLVILGGLVAFLVLDWSTFFDTFHNLFFAQGTWTFAYSDTLIRLFPIDFWQTAAYTLGGLSAGLALISAVAGGWWWRRLSRTA